MMPPHREHVHNQRVRNRAIQFLNQVETLVHVHVATAGGDNAFDSGIVLGVFQHVLKKIARAFHTRQGAAGCKTLEFRIHGVAFGHGLFQCNDHPVVQERIE